MKKDLALKIVLGISTAGVLFSGYLSYDELFKQTCTLGCPEPMLGLPVCVYGLIMYLGVFVVSLIGIKSKN